MTKRDTLRSVPRLFAAAEQFDTRSVRRVFSDVHAVGENDQNYFLPAGKKLCEAFLALSKTEAEASVLMFCSVSRGAQPLGNVHNVQIERFCEKRRKLIYTKGKHMFIIGFHIMSSAAVLRTLQRAGILSFLVCYIS